VSDLPLSCGAATSSTAWTTSFFVSSRRRSCHDAHDARGAVRAGRRAGRRAVDRRGSDAGSCGGRGAGRDAGVGRATGRLHVHPRPVPDPPIVPTGRRARGHGDRRGCGRFDDPRRDPGRLPAPGRLGGPRRGPRQPLLPGARGHPSRRRGTVRTQPGHRMARLTLGSPLRDRLDSSTGAGAQERAQRRQPSRGCGEAADGVHQAGRVVARATGGAG
jgi:hypothetical protein